MTNNTEPNIEPNTEESPTNSTDPSQEYLLGWKRALADYDNLKKDLFKEREGMRRNIKQDTAESLIPILDHFDQALKFKPASLAPNVENWLVGMLHVRNQLEAVLIDLGLEPFGAVGDAFDPHKHDANGEREDEAAQDHSILEVLQRGWKMGDQVVKPAIVIVKK